jgi:hypothetical protein
METAVALPARFDARFDAFPDAAPVALRDVEDLHDADLDAILADQLEPVAAASALAQLVLRPGSALMVHDLGVSAAVLVAE